MGADALMRHQSADVRCCAAKCLAEVLRIFVPSPPLEKERCSASKTDLIPRVLQVLINVNSVVWCFHFQGVEVMTMYLYDIMYNSVIVYIHSTSSIWQDATNPGALLGTVDLVEGPQWPQLHRRVRLVGASHRDTRLHVGLRLPRA